MAKKMVRGITDVKTINNQDFDTNNVNDLLSDGQYNYIHRKKGKAEEYHNLTDNIKTISSDNTELLSVTNNNKTTNTATLHPKHDAQKEQLLESTRNTISIHHGTNGTAEKTTVDTNPEKVLEHENLLTDYGISKTTSGNTTKLGHEYTKVADNFNLDTLTDGNVRGYNLINSPVPDKWFFVSGFSEGKYSVQRALTLVDKNNIVYVRYRDNGVWGKWREQVGDKSVIDALLSQKEQVLESTRNTVTINHGTNGTAEKTTVDVNFEKVQEKLTAGDGITIQGNTISASAPVEGASVSIQGFSTPDAFNAFKHVVTIEQKTLTTFSFECYTETAEHVLSGQLKEELGKFIGPGYSASNGALKLTNDGTDIKLINSTPEYHNIQHATFTFYKKTGGGGGGDVPPGV